MLGLMPGLDMLVIMRYQTILLLSCLFMLSACTSMVMGGGQQAGVYTQPDDRSLEQVSLDAEITQNVRIALGNPRAISVSTANGIVTLQGSVASERDIQRLVSRVYRVNGVQGVDSRLTVSSP